MPQRVVPALCGYELDEPATWAVGDLEPHVATDWSDMGNCGGCSEKLMAKRKELY